MKSRMYNISFFYLLRKPSLFSKREVKSVRHGLFLTNSQYLSLLIRSSPVFLLGTYRLQRNHLVKAHSHQANLSHIADATAMQSYPSFFWKPVVIQFM